MLFSLFSLTPRVFHISFLAWKFFVSYYHMIRTWKLGNTRVKKWIFLQNEGRHRNGKMGLKLKRKCYYFHDAKMMYPCFSTLGRWCIKFLEASLSCKWDQYGRCSDSPLAPDWWELTGRARNLTGHRLGSTINGRKADNWPSMYLCHHRWQHLLGTHRTLVKNKRSSSVWHLSAPGD